MRNVTQVSNPVVLDIPGYLLRTNTSYKHLAKKFERAVLTCFGRDGSEMAVSL